MVQPGSYTESGLPMEPVYGPGSPAGWDAAERLGEPGGFPYTAEIFTSGTPTSEVVTWLRRRTETSVAVGAE